MTSQEFNKKRIMSMTQLTKVCICPKCKRHCYPRYVDYIASSYANENSRLFWCPLCFQGEAAIFWKEL